MEILADAHIPFVEQAFSNLGHVTAVPAGAIRPPLPGHTEVLLVRSVTRVDAELLRGSRVRFVATATSGCDHVDVAYLRQAGIGFAHAPGCNANAVAEYVLSALLALVEQGRLAWPSVRVGIIGCGHVGSNLLRKLQTLGVRCLVNDPPLQASTGDPRFVDLKELFPCDVLTLHVPLVRGGRHPTFHLVEESFLARMKSGAVLINTARGSVVDERALLAALTQGRLAAVVDVWPDEPEIDFGLVERVALATPHIAGHSFEGKVRGTEMIYRAACRFFQAEPLWTADSVLASAPRVSLTFGAGESDEAVLRRSVFAAYDVRRDDAALRELARAPEDRRAAAFVALREDYPDRPEFSRVEIHLPPGRKALRNRLQALGFVVRERS